jgi:hypothetical protein
MTGFCPLDFVEIVFVIEQWNRRFETAWIHRRQCDAQLKLVFAKYRLDNTSKGCDVSCGHWDDWRKPGDAEAIAGWVDSGFT